MTQAAVHAAVHAVVCRLVERNCAAATIAARAAAECRDTGDRPGLGTREDREVTAPGPADEVAAGRRVILAGGLLAGAAAVLFAVRSVGSSRLVGLVGGEPAAPVASSVESVVDGRHADGSLVTVIGIAGPVEYRTGPDGRWWATFLLIGPATAVRVFAGPAPHRRIDAITPAPLGRPGPARPVWVSVTGYVDGRDRVPVLAATRIGRIAADEGAAAPAT